MIMLMNDEATEDNFQQFPSGSGGILAEISSKKQNSHHKYYYVDAIFFLRYFLLKRKA